MVKGLSCPQAIQETTEERIQCIQLKDACLCQYYAGCCGKFKFSSASQTCLHRKKSKQHISIKIPLFLKKIFNWFFPN